MSIRSLYESIPVLIFRVIVGLVSIVGNSIILYIAFKFSKFRTSHCNCLIALLALVELLVGKIFIFVQIKFT